jgi:hypothetical protein
MSAPAASKSTSHSSSASAFDKALVPTDATQHGVLAAAELARIKLSLRVNGVAVVRGFIEPVAVQRLAEDAKTAVADNFDLGVPYGLEIRSKRTSGTQEFSHPFLFSGAASSLVTSAALIDIIEDYIAAPAIIHHALFQLSLPVDQPTVDWHVDTGSNKALNGIAKFPDRRLRMITYLSDVKSGGLGYMLDTRDATNVFLAQPQGQLFPLDKIPNEPARRITIEEPAGTILFFDAHGLHRPEPPEENRLVLNTWFARNDFSAKLPPVLVSIAGIPKENYERVYVFGNARGMSVDKLQRKPVEKRRGLRAIWNKLRQ